MAAFIGSNLHFLKDQYNYLYITFNAKKQFVLLICCSLHLVDTKVLKQLTFI